MAGSYFEDFEPGQVYELGTRTITEEELVAFAREWDPQPFHVDPEAARESVFGGLIASGWQTGAIWMRMYVDTMLGSAARGSPGIEELRWLAPVRPVTRSGAADRARGDAVGDKAGSGHGSHPGRDGEPGRRHRDGDDLARPLRATIVTGCCARDGQEEFFGEKTATHDAQVPPQGA